MRQHVRYEKEICVYMTETRTSTEVAIKALSQDVASLQVPGSKATFIFKLLYHFGVLVLDWPLF